MRSICLILTLFLLLGCTKEPVTTDTILAGKWKLVEVRNATVTTKDAAYPEDVLITFRNRAFLGTTGRNEFFGRYQISGESRLIFEDFGISEVSESEIGTAFLQALMKGYDPRRNQHEMSFSIQGSSLFLSAGNSRIALRAVNQSP